MRSVIPGQGLFILCCLVYLIWWYRCFRPGVIVNRVGGVNGLLLLLTAVLGILGIALTLAAIPKKSPVILIAGILAYVFLMFFTGIVLRRTVTTELLLIVAWTTLEVMMVHGVFNDNPFMYAVIAAAFLISMVIYVAYYRMEEMKAFYAAMIPLITEALAMLILLISARFIV